MYQRGRIISMKMLACLSKTGIRLQHLTGLNLDGAEFRTTGSIPGFEHALATAREGVRV